MSPSAMLCWLGAHLHPERLSRRKPCKLAFRKCLVPQNLRTCPPLPPVRTTVRGLLQALSTQPQIGPRITVDFPAVIRRHNFPSQELPSGRSLLASSAHPSAPRSIGGESWRPISDCQGRVARGGGRPSGGLQLFAPRPHSLQTTTTNNDMSSPISDCRRAGSSGVGGGLRRSAASYPPDRTACRLLPAG